MINFWIFFAVLALIVITLAVAIRMGSEPRVPITGHKYKLYNWFKKPKNLIQLGTLAFVGAYTIVTFNAFFVGNRAFIYFDKATFETVNKPLPPESNGKITLFNAPYAKAPVIDINFLLTNAGGTSTREMRVILDCRPLAFNDPRQNEPFVLFKWNDAAARNEIAGPKQTIQIGPCEMQPELVLNAQMGIMQIFFMGEIRYKDRVAWGGWANHVTQFSQQLVILAFDPQNNRIEAVTQSVGMHNCADDDCPTN